MQTFFFLYTELKILEGLKKQAFSFSVFIELRGFTMDRYPSNQVEGAHFFCN
jgi:hypothetical protein